MIENYNKIKDEEICKKIKTKGITLEQIKDKIVFRVIGENKMQEYLKRANGRVVYKSIDYGMYIIYAAEIADKISMVFTENIIAKINSSIEEIEKLAMENTERIYPPILKNLESAIVETLTRNLYNRNLLDVEGLTLGLHERSQMHVLTNIYAKYGASVIKYKGVLERIGKIFGEDYYMIPSSIHEFILMPKSMEVAGKELEWILKDVNEGFVKKEEILGDRVLYYSIKRGRITVI